MDELNDALEVLGVGAIDWPGPAYWIAIVLFSIIGMILYVLGRRRRKRTVKWVALALMLYPYVVPGTVPVWCVGVALCVLAAWCWRQPAAPGPGT
jgi:hypothetical protein